MELDQKKYRALVSYAVWKTTDVADFGLTKLNKVIWFVEARMFESYGRALTGERFVRRKYGPVPAHLDEVLSDLIDQGVVEQTIERHYDFQVKRFATNCAPDSSAFSAEELQLIDWWISHIANDHTAVSISEKSHDYGWRIVPEGEELPVKAFLASRIRHPQTDEELSWAENAAREVAKG